MEYTERILKVLRNNIERAEKASTRQYFSIFIRLSEDEKNEIPLIEHASGIDEFDKIIEEAKDNDPIEIIISITSKKTDPRRRSKDYVIKFQHHSENEKTENTQEFIQQTIAEQLSKFKEGLSGMEETTGLGAIEEKFQHQGAILQLKTEKKINDIEHSKEIDDLKREIAQRDENITVLKLDLQEAESDFDELESNFVEYKKNKFAGISEQLSAVGTKALAGLAAKFIPMLSDGGSPVSGIEADNNQGNKTEIEEQNEVNILTEQIRDMLNDFTEEQFKNFYNLILLIAQDKETLSIVMKFLKPNGNGEGASQ